MELLYRVGMWSSQYKSTRARQPLGFIARFRTNFLPCRSRSRKSSPKLILIRFQGPIRFHHAVFPLVQ